MTDTDGNEKKGNVLGRAWRAFWRPATRYSFGGLLIGGTVLGVLGWGGFNWAVEATNTETFCISCHEMKDNVYKEYKETVHYYNGSGVRAICTDCHVPKEWHYKMMRKVQASNELFHHFMGTIDTREKFEKTRLELATNVWRTMKSTDSRECRNCHDFDSMDFNAQESRAADRHDEAAEQGMTCIDCHQGIAHHLPEGAEERYKEVAAGVTAGK